MQTKIMFHISIIIGTLMCVNFSETKQERMRPFGLRRTYDKGIGDRYYTGLPAYSYQHMWPEWKRDIWYTIGDWKNEESPEWITYYSYPYVVWPNFYRYFGSPYYTKTQKAKRLAASAQTQRTYNVTEDSASF